MTRTGSVFRRRWPVWTALAVVLAVGLAIGTLLATNEGEQPVPEAAAAQLQPDLTDPGLYAQPPAPAAPIAEPQEPQLTAASQAALPKPQQDGQDPEADQVVPQGSGALAQWLANRPEEMGSFSTQDAIIATDLDMEWMLYQAVEKGEMAQDEADVFRTWFEQRPTLEEAPELANYLPGEVHLPDESGFSGTDLGSLKSR